MRALVLVAVVVACGKGDGGAGSGAPIATPVTTGSGSSGSAIGATGSAGSGSAAGSAGAPQVSAKIAAARCDEPCLFLVDTPIDQYPTAYKAACGKTTPELGFSDCKALDVARNCIYAAHGKVYKKKKWKQRFATKPWYTPDATFKESAFTPIEHANVIELYHRGKGCKKGLHISATDNTHLVAWFTAFTAAARTKQKLLGMHDVVMMDYEGTPLDASSFLAKLDVARGEYLDFDPAGSNTERNGELDYKKATKEYIALDASTENDLLEKLVAKVPGDHAKLRAILVDFDLRDNETGEATVNEGIYVYVLYDGDKLAAMAFTTYLLD